MDKEAGVTYNLNSCIVKEFNKYIEITTPYNETYRFSTTEGKHRYTFPGMFLQKYKYLYHNYRNYEDANDVLMSMVIYSIN